MSSKRELLMAKGRCHIRRMIGRKDQEETPL
jgi:hypothetical protein